MAAKVCSVCGYTLRQRGYREWAARNGDKQICKFCDKEYSLNRHGEIIPRQDSIRKREYSLWQMGERTVFTFYHKGSFSERGVVTVVDEFDRHILFRSFDKGDLDVMRRSVAAWYGPGFDVIVQLDSAELNKYVNQEPFTITVTLTEREKAATNVES